MIIEIDNTLVSDRVLSEHFVCDLSACKGACCVEGDSGAPLEEEELAQIDANWEGIKPYIRKQGVDAIEAQGKYIVDDLDGEWVTPLIDGKECAYTTFDENGVAHCGIEQAHEAGASTFKKPISCYLYPVRVKRYAKFEAVNFHEWEICKPACDCGAKLKMPVFRFLKGPLVSKYGEDWYSKLELAAASLIK